jgi:hypothetical protein
VLVAFYCAAKSVLEYVAKSLFIGPDKTATWMVSTAFIVAARLTATDS